MKLPNRITQFLNRPKSSEASAASSEPSDGSEITWDSLAAERQDAATPSITYDDLARLVRFPGDTEAAAVDDDTDGAVTLELQKSTEAEPTSPELQAFKNFFKTDIRIKRELLDAAPKPTDDYDEASRMDYVEDASRTFRDFRPDFLGIAHDFGLSESVKRSTQDFFRRGQRDFALRKYDYGVTQDVYRKAFADMRPTFIEKVKNSFVGYSASDGSLESIIGQASTVNELLHAYHSYIMNNHIILRRVPVLAEKENNFGYPITLRGDHSALGQQVFDSLPDDLDVGWTDIVAAEDHLMMMVRDRGHALAISSEPDVDDPLKIWVNYNIPKICDEEMIRALPGLADLTPNGARGTFVTSRDGLGPSLADFISKVPTDSDKPSAYPEHPNMENI